MNSSACPLWLALAAVILLAGPLAIGADPATEAIKIRKGIPNDWKAAIQKNAAERKAIAAALMEVALDKKVKNDDRNEAIVLLVEIPSKDVIEFLLKHLTLEIPLYVEGGDADRARRRPCRYALSKSDWFAVPQMLAFLKPKRTDEELNDLAYVLREAIGPPRAIALLTYEKQGAASPLRENLEKVIARLKADKG